MTVASVYAYAVKPGGMADFQAGLKEAKSIIERLGTGLNEVRAFRTIVSGPSSGQITFRIVYDSLSSYAATIEAEAEDEFQEMVRRVSSPDAPATLLTHALATDLLEPAGDGTGGVVVTIMARVKPGRLGDLIGPLEQSTEHALSHGARLVTHRRVSVAGPATGVVVSAYEVDDLATWAASRDALATSDTMQEVSASLSGEDSPLVPGTMSVALMTEIPI
ncbi:MAG: hypothetical protein R2849_18970 [Thermomicrobiales bacterium]